MGFDCFNTYWFKVHICIFFANQGVIFNRLSITPSAFSKKVERSAFLSLHRFRKNIQASISASGLTMEDFLLESSDVEAQASGPSLSPSTEDRPILLESPESLKLKLKEGDDYPQRTSIARNEELRGTMAGLSFHGKDLVIYVGIARQQLR